MAIEWSDVRSSNVAAVGWNEDAGELLVRFKSGAEYAYSNQSEAAYQDLLTTDSPGSYVSKWLRNQPSRKVR